MTASGPEIFFRLGLSAKVVCEALKLEVVAGDIFTTPNSLKSQMRRKLLSPYSKFRAVNVQVVYAFEDDSSLRSGAAPQVSIAQGARHDRRPLSRGFLWRFSYAGHRSTRHRLRVAGIRKPSQERTSAPVQIAVCKLGAGGSVAFRSELEHQRSPGPHYLDTDQGSSGLQMLSNVFLRMPSIQCPNLKCQS